MFIQAFDNNLSAMQFVAEYYNTPELCDKPVNACFFVFISVPDWYKTQKMRDKAFFEDPFMLEYYLDRYKINKIVIKLLMIF